MTYVGLALCLALIVFGVLSAGASLAVALSWERARRLSARWASSQRAALLLSLRLLPTALPALFVVGILLPSYWTFEPRETDEAVGLGLLVPTCLFALVIGIGISRGVAACIATRRIVSRWVEIGEPIRLPGVSVPAYGIDHEFPLVSLVGLWRPRLFLARHLLDRCTLEEITAILAHESGHFGARDNLKRLLIRSCPDLLGSAAIGKRLEADWSQASEEAADDQAASRSRLHGLDLAAALVKVARLAAASRPASFPLSALYRGEDVAHRVARLIRGDGPPGAAVLLPRAAWLPLAAALALFGTVACDVGLLHSVHHLTERVIGLLQ